MNQSIDFQSKPMDRLVYKGFCHELVNGEAYPGLLQTPKTESFEKIVNDQNCLTIVAKLSVLDVCGVCGNW